MSHGWILFFDITVLLGVFLATCILLPALFSKNVHRSIGWYSMMGAWLVYGLSYSLLIGLQERDDPPPKGLCLLQTLLIYPAPVLAASATLCYYIEFYFIVSSCKRENLAQVTSPSRTRVIWLALIPWIVWMAALFETGLILFHGDNISLLERAEHRFYCHLRLIAPSLVTGALALFMVAVLIVLQVRTGFTMRRHWDLFKRLTETDRQVLVTIYIRFIYCSASGVITTILCSFAFAMPAPNADCLQVLYPIPSIIFALAFGTQKDLRQAWCFWRKPEPYTSIVFHHHTLSTTNYFTSHAQPADSSKPVDESELEDSESIFSMGSRMDLLHETSLDKTEESTMDNDSKGVLVEFLARKKPKMVSVARMRSLRVSLKEMYLPTNQ